MNDYHQLITADPDVRMGKPCIKGTQITIFEVLSCYASGKNKDSIRHNFPNLSTEQIHACFAYAADHYGYNCRF